MVQGVEEEDEEEEFLYFCRMIIVDIELRELSLERRTITPEALQSSPPTIILNTKQSRHQNTGP